MKTLDANSLHNGIDELLQKVNLQINQLKQIKNVIKDFSDMEDSFNGQGGKAIRAFYQDWHLPILSFYINILNNYKKLLTNINEAVTELESDPKKRELASYYHLIYF